MVKKRTFDKRFIILLLLGFLFAIITFEAFQQLFYINRFELNGVAEISVFNLIKGQLYRWGIWLLFSPALWYFSLKKAIKTKLTAADLLQYTGLILILVFISITIIAGFNTILNDDSFADFISEYLPFFIFQKGLIFTLGYTAVAVILYQYFTNKKLQIEVQTLSEIKKNNQSLYKKLNPKMDDTSSVLNIKIGNKHKIIPIKDIRWIAADDYCVKIHSDRDISYSMRSSLKALEAKLKDNNFLRVHRNALVNMSLVKEINFTNSPKLLLKDGAEIPISKSKIKTVKDFLS